MLLMPDKVASMDSTVLLGLLGQVNAILNQMTEGLVVFDPEGRLLDMNRAAIEIHRLEGAESLPEHLEGMAEIFDVFDLDGRPLALQDWPIGRALRGEAFSMHEVRVRSRRTGRMWYGSYGGSPVRGPDGRMLLAIVTVRDVTAQKLAEQAMRDSEEKFRKLADNANAIIGIVQGNRFIYANPYALKATGYSQEDLFKVSFIDLVHPDHKAMMAERAARRMRGEYVPAPYEFKMVTRSGETRWLDFAPAYMEYRGQPAIIGIAYDITERKQAEEKLRQLAEELRRSNQDLQQFAYVASHDLQEPLRMVTLFLDLLNRKYGSQLDDKAREIIGHAMEGAERMSRLVRDLLNYSRAGSGELERAPVDLNAVMDEVRMNLKAAIDEAGAKVTHELLPTVVGNGPQLSQVLQNLVSNAIKFRREGIPAEVTVSARRTEKEWVVSVSDNGVGIEPSHYEKVFMLFQRLHARDKYEGSGIGLAVVKKIVERCGGHVCVHSRPGEGSTFCFTVPV